MFCCNIRQESFDKVQEKDKKLIKIAAYSSFCITFIIVLCRFSAFFTTHSIAIEASLVDAVKDCFVSSFNAFFVLLSIKPADKKYPFGYGKMEAFAAFLQSLFLFCTGCIIVLEAVRQIISGEKTEVLYDQTAIWILFVSLLLAFILSRIQAFVAKRTKSLAILADSVHYKSDVIMNMGIIVCLFISFNSPIFDVIVGLTISVYLIITAIFVAKPSIMILLDRSLGANLIENITGIIQDNSCTVKNIRTHGTGRGEFIAVDLFFDGEVTIEQAEGKKQTIEKEMHEYYPRAFILISSSLK